MAVRDLFMKIHKEYVKTTWHSNLIVLFKRKSLNLYTALWRTLDLYHAVSALHSFKNYQFDDFAVGEKEFIDKPELHG